MSEPDLLRHSIHKVLVTEGCGFIGATVVRDLLDRSFEVVVLDDLSKGPRAHLDGLDLELIEVERGVADCWDWFRATGCFHQGVRGTSV